MSSSVLWLAYSGAFYVDGRITMQSPSWKGEIRDRYGKATHTTSNLHASARGVKTEAHVARAKHGM